MLEQGIVLKDKTHPAFLGPQFCHIPPVQPDPALVDWHQPGNQAQHCGFAASAGSEQDKKLPIADLQGDVVYDRVAIITFGQSFENDRHKIPLILEIK
jgi:hypothetical protein